jgi:hypothetical protein
MNEFNLHKLDYPSKNPVENPAFFGLFNRFYLIYREKYLKKQVFVAIDLLNYYTVKK